jgi:hypothetical protein
MTNKTRFDARGNPLMPAEDVMQTGCGKIVALLASLVIGGATALTAMSVFQTENPADQTRVHDFPPPVSTLPEPARVLAVVERGLNLNPVTTNQAELDLVGEIKAMKKELQDAEQATYAKDPLLRSYGIYVEQAHDWVMKYHAREFEAANLYFSSGVQTNSQQVNKTRKALVALIDMALWHELASDTNYAPLLKAAFEASASKDLTRLGVSYGRNDDLIGFRTATPPAQVNTFEAYAAEFDQRYALVKTKLDEIQSAQAVPAEVVAGWRYGDLYRMLDGSAQLYVELRTPEELTRLREQLRRKFIALSWLQTPSATKAP